MTAQELIEHLEDANFEPVSYSGRGMFGKNCVAIKNESLWEIARSLPEDLQVPEPSADQFGRGMVYYWPRFSWPDEGKG